jgi:hypothetical protein
MDERAQRLTAMVAANDLEGLRELLSASPSEASQQLNWAQVNLLHYACQTPQVTAPLVELLLMFQVDVNARVSTSLSQPDTQLTISCV